MSQKIECPACGESENLRGHESDEGIVIVCGNCHATWLRDAVPPKCATCGGADVEDRVLALTQYSRGTQLSIVALGSVPLCRTCDAQMIEWAGAGRPVPSSYQSAALGHGSGREGQSTDGHGHILITP